MLPTLCSFTGLKPPADRHLDGTNFRGLFRGEKIQRTQPLYWHFYGARGAHQVALREGDWKLIAQMDAPPIKHRASTVPADQQAIKTAPLGSMELYNLKTDRAETTDQARIEAARFNWLSAQMKAIYGSVQRDTPVWPAWEFDRYEAQRIQWPPYRGTNKVPLRKPQIPGDFRKNPLSKRP